MSRLVCALLCFASASCVDETTILAVLDCSPGDVTQLPFLPDARVAAPPEISCPAERVAGLRLIGAATTPDGFVVLTESQSKLEAVRFGPDGAMTGRTGSDIASDGAYASVIAADGRVFAAWRNGMSVELLELSEAAVIPLQLIDEAALFEPSIAYNDRDNELAVAISGTVHRFETDGEQIDRVDYQLKSATALIWDGARYVISGASNDSGAVRVVPFSPGATYTEPCVEMSMGSRRLVQGDGRWDRTLRYNADSDRYVFTFRVLAPNAQFGDPLPARVRVGMFSGDRTASLIGSIGGTMQLRPWAPAFASRGSDHLFITSHIARTSNALRTGENSQPISASFEVGCGSFAEELRVLASDDGYFALWSDGAGLSWTSIDVSN